MPGDEGDGTDNSPSEDVRSPPESGPNDDQPRAETDADRSEGSDDRPSPEPGTSAEESVRVPSPTEHPIKWYLGSRNALVVASRDILVSVAMVAAIALVLFAISGVWPPLVAVESGSMEPNMKQGDLVLIVDNERYAHPEADQAGVLTRERGAELGHESFGNPGNVIVFQRNGRGGTPIIHRAHHHVENDENWYDRANREHLRGATRCEEMRRNACPAPHEGYVTKGDANPAYDQVQGQSTVVKERWIQGKAVARIPWLGCIRLELTSPEHSCLNGRN